MYHPWQSDNVEHVFHASKQQTERSGEASGGNWRIRGLVWPGWSCWAWYESRTPVDTPTGCGQNMVALGCSLKTLSGPGAWKLTGRVLRDNFTDFADTLNCCLNPLWYLQKMLNRFRYSKRVGDEKLSCIALGDRLERIGEVLWSLGVTSWSLHKDKRREAMTIRKWQKW
jgi:hypothetical protein